MKEQSEDLDSSGLFDKISQAATRPPDGYHIRSKIRPRTFAPKIRIAKLTIRFRIWKYMGRRRNSVPRFPCHEETAFSERIFRPREALVGGFRRVNR